MMLVPVLETERLRLRGHSVADFDALAAMWADESTVRFIGGKTSSVEESWARLHRYLGHWAALGHGYWLIEEKASGAYVGDVGFATFKRTMEPPLDEPEHGWSLAAWARGRGYANEAVGASLRWAQAHFPKAAFVCMISPDNAASIRLAQKNGYVEFTRTTYKDDPTVLFRRDPR